MQLPVGNQKTRKHLFLNIYAFLSLLSIKNWLKSTFVQWCEEFLYSLFSRLYFTRLLACQGLELSVARAIRYGKQITTPNYSTGGSENTILFRVIVISITLPGLGQVQTCFALIRCDTPKVAFLSPTHMMLSIVWTIRAFHLHGSIWVHEHISSPCLDDPEGWHPYGSDFGSQYIRWHNNMLTGKRYQSPARTDVSASWKFHVQLTDGAKIQYPLERVELGTFCSPAATLSILLIRQAHYHSVYVTPFFFHFFVSHRHYLLST